jgi:hypothetical protein
MPDMMGFLIAFMFVALIGLAVLSLVVISIGWRTKVDARTGAFVLRYSLPPRVFAVLAFFILPVGVIVMLAVAPPAQAGTLLAAQIGLLLFKLLGWVLLQMTFRSRLVVSPDGLVSYSPWRRARAMRWDEVVEVRHECPAAWFIFTAADGRRIDVPLYFAGLASLVAAIREHLAPDVYARAVPGFALVTKRATERQDGR